jgi:hypothetical protein
MIHDYQVFESRAGYDDAFGKAVAEEYVPTNFPTAMRRRITAMRERSREEQRWWVEQHLDTIDGIAYFQKRVKFVPDYFDSKDKLTPVGPDGNVRLSKDGFDMLSGREFTQSELEGEARVGQYNNPSQARTNIAWQTLAREQRLLEDYICAVYTTIDQNFADFRSSAAAIGEFNLRGQGMQVLLYWLHPQARSPFPEPIIQPVTLSSLNHWTSLSSSQVQSDLTSCPSLRGGSRIIALKFTAGVKINPDDDHDDDPDDLEDSTP